MRGFAGEQLKSKVSIIPEEKYPFKILNARAKHGKDIRFRLDEVNGENGLEYALTVENQRLKEGRYFDIITLETDSKIQPKLNVRVYGDLQLRSDAKKNETQ